MATSAFSVVCSSSLASGTASKRIIGISGGSDGLDVRRSIVAKPAPSPRRMEVKANAHAVPKINSKEEEASSSAAAPKRFYNQLPDWRMLFSAITTVFLAAKKRLPLLDRKDNQHSMLADAFVLGKIDGLIFKQNFPIRSYETGADRATTIETLMSHLQETALNLARSAGLLCDGFGSTPEMSRKNLIWVVTKMQVFVEHYPRWGDIVEVDTWIGGSGKNKMSCDWHVKECRTGQTVLRATSTWVMMNKYTRKFSKMPEEVRSEISPLFVERSSIVGKVNSEIPKLDESRVTYVRRGLTPRWSDLDVNQHVNNVKYIGWILESAPISIMESHELASMTLEYRRECKKDNVVQSLTAVSDIKDESGAPSGIECQHLLRLESGAEVVRGRTVWRPKEARERQGLGVVPAGMKK